MGPECVLQLFLHAPLLQEVEILIEVRVRHVVLVGGEAVAGAAEEEGEVEEVEEEAEVATRTGTCTRTLGGQPHRRTRCVGTTGLRGKRKPRSKAILKKQW
jgi:hypothetical protein